MVTILSLIVSILEVHFPVKMVAGVSIFMFRTIESSITRALSSGFSVGASLSGENLFNVLIRTEERCFDYATSQSPNCPAAKAL